MHIRCIHIHSLMFSTHIMHLNDHRFYFVFCFGLFLFSCSCFSFQELVSRMHIACSSKSWATTFCLLLLFKLCVGRRAGFEEKRNFIYVYVFWARFLFSLSLYLCLPHIRSPIFLFRSKGRGKKSVFICFVLLQIYIAPQIVLCMISYAGDE